MSSKGLKAGCSSREQRRIETDNFVFLQIAPHAGSISISLSDDEGNLHYVGNMDLKEGQMTAFPPPTTMLEDWGRLVVAAKAELLTVGGLIGWDQLPFDTVYLNEDGHMVDAKEAVAD